MEPKVQPPTLTLGGTPLRTSAKGLVSLTDLFKAAEAQGLATGKRDPRRWKLQDGAQFIDFVAQQLHVPERDIYVSSKARADRGGGSFAHWQIALAYAKYLSPALHMQVNEVYGRFKAGDVTLAADIADRAKPADAEWLARRTAGVVARNRLTSALAAHGVQGKGFADCTNAIYIGVLGGKKSQVCAQRGLPANANLRNHMDADQLVATAMSEIVARKRIVRQNARGNEHCAGHCLAASTSVMQLMR